MGNKNTVFLYNKLIYFDKPLYPVRPIYKVQRSLHVATISPGLETALLSMLAMASLVATLIAS